MSFADELRKAEARMKAQLEQEAKKKTTRPRKKAVGQSSSSGGSSTNWKIEDDIIALYLQRTNGSKFFRENYSKKRKVPLRTMVRKMQAFEDHAKSRKNPDITDQTVKVAAEFSSMNVDRLQKLVIAILRGEYIYGVASPVSSPAAKTDADTKVVRRGDND